MPTIIASTRLRARKDGVIRMYTATKATIPSSSATALMMRGSTAPNSILAARSEDTKVATPAIDTAMPIASP